jgi:hypothetical protein
MSHCLQLISLNSRMNEFTREYSPLIIKRGLMEWIYSLF